MTISKELHSAFTFYRLRGYRPARALEQSRIDLEARRAHYPGARWSRSPAVHRQESQPIGNLPFPEYQNSGLVYLEDDTGGGMFRHSGKVDEIRRGIDHNGWYTDPYGDVFKDGMGLCWGVVVQLPARNGTPRYYPGYQFGGVDDGPTIDLSASYDSPESASYPADSMAEHAAQEERDYQSAWQAGVHWRDKAEGVKNIRAEAMGLLKERRTARQNAAMDYPRMCEGLRRLISTALSEIAELREEMTRYAEGNDSYCHFYPGEKRLQDAFNEGAEKVVI